LRSRKTDKQIERLQGRLQDQEDHNEVGSDPLATARIRCPLLDDADRCILYSRRPLTCRVYGIPTKINGKGRVCGKTGFLPGETYPTFDLDEANRKMYDLSRELLAVWGARNPDRATYLISVSKAIRTPPKDLIKATFGMPRVAG
jgi:Fe-S-cluster containining protein